MILSYSHYSFTEEVRNVPDVGREPMMVAMATCHSLTIIEGELSGDPLDIRMFQSTLWVRILHE